MEAAARWSDDEDGDFIPRRHYFTIEETKEAEYARLMAAERVREAEAEDENLQWKEEDVEGELEDEEYDELLEAVLKVQLIVRARQARLAMARRLRSVWIARTQGDTRRRVYFNIGHAARHRYGPKPE